MIFLLRSPNLTELNLNWNEISDISPLSNLTNLKILYLENNELEDISAISPSHIQHQPYMEVREAAYQGLEE